LDLFNFFEFKKKILFKIAEKFFEKYGERAILLTYTRKLKEESRNTINKLGLNRVVEAHSFHAASAKFFNNSGNQNSQEEKFKLKTNDDFIEEATKKKPINDLDFGLVILDEGTKFIFSNKDFYFFLF
jgi:hypothetical protein